MTLYLTTTDFNRKKQSMLTKEKQSKKTNLLQGWSHPIDSWIHFEV